MLRGSSSSLSRNCYCNPAANYSMSHCIYCTVWTHWIIVIFPLLLSAGGRQGKMPVTALEAFDLETKSWTRFPCIPSRRAFSCCATNDRSLFSLGGLQQPGPHNFYSRPHFVSTMEEYDVDQGTYVVSVNECVSYNRGEKTIWGICILLWTTSMWNLKIMTNLMAMINYYIL